MTILKNYKIQQKSRFKVFIWAITLTLNIDTIYRLQLKYDSQFCKQVDAIEMVTNASFLLPRSLFCE